MTDNKKEKDLIENSKTLSDAKKKEMKATWTNKKKSTTVIEQILIYMQRLQVRILKQESKFQQKNQLKKQKNGLTTKTECNFMA